ncbi:MULTISPECIES: hypothetical protein [unclassified Variovorax]|uniref:hypothetical protein n=1 Tax=unclassified Variovorax TaxID=663243 RepID=UPI00076DAB31|nr:MULTISPECIES: hypothetical protein [unclassified Variovorax]KWT94096.1 hypothetical protein APY03_2692 [Variovorax sp. WDL1]PNG59944.1 hypothetical protein CHC07_01673 [Variovorax sp. B4]PNG60264.1 hypothetical protein CHC06_00161 [Variovorax sp. B2]VTV13898.1 hypothetical protein WDL1CHR_04510 [Variovorax sp. WDL1]
MTDDALPVAPLRDACLGPVLAWQAALGECVIQAQRNQYEMLTAWGKSLGAFNQDLWDRWVCRFGGGVPLDG